MKNMVICAVYDKTGGLFMQPAFFINDVEAVRSFQLACEKNEVFKKWPEDYAIHKLGEIDLETGKVEQLTAKLADATSFVAQEKKED